MAGKQRETVFLSKETTDVLDKEIKIMKEKGWDVNYSDALNAIVKVFDSLPTI